MAKLPAEIRIEINKSMPGHEDDIEDKDQTWIFTGKIITSLQIGITN